MTVRLHNAIIDARAAALAVVRVLRADYPVGSEIAWRDGSKYRRGTVLMHTYSERIKVRNDTTGGERFIGAYQVTQEAPQ